MARANTYEMEKRTPINLTNKCQLCENKPSYRAWYYPTYMNGDAMCGGDFCEDHKNVDLKRLHYED